MDLGPLESYDTEGVPVRGSSSANVKDDR
jgi:hypothetical protein